MLRGVRSLLSDAGLQIALAIAACVESPSRLTRSTLIAVSMKVSTVAFGSDARNAVHCESA